MGLEQTASANEMLQELLFQSCISIYIQYIFTYIFITVYN